MEHRSVSVIIPTRTDDSVGGAAEGLPTFKLETSAPSDASLELF